MIEVIAFLGNPGPEYARTRHNAGWILADAFAQTYKASWKSEPRFNSLVAKADVEGKKVYLIKPQTYMNLSGEAIAPFLKYHKHSPENILLVHDEVAFESQHARLSLGGSSGGHNGVGNVIERLGTEGFWRLRLGTGPRNPLLTLTEWALGPLAEPELTYLASKELINTLHLVVDNGPAKVQNNMKLS
jgi:PTH1 family peptidyl-tRNA hydrolase